MPRRSSATAGSEKSATKAPPSGRRRRQSKVADLILNLLAGSPLSGQELLKQGKFSPGALYLNVRALRKAGRIEGRRDGRRVVFSLVDGGGRPAAAANAVTQGASASAASSARLTPELQQALDAVTLRLSATGRLQEKLNVLGHLARNMQSPASALLRSTLDDLARLTGCSPP